MAITEVDSAETLDGALRGIEVLIFKHSPT
jgi:hypothetical protein